MPKSSSPCLSLHPQGTTACAIHWATPTQALFLFQEYIKIILTSGPLHSLLPCLELFSQFIGLLSPSHNTGLCQEHLLRELSQLLYFKPFFNPTPISMTYCSVIQGYFCYIILCFLFLLKFYYLSPLNCNVCCLMAGVLPSLLIQHLKIYLVLCSTTNEMNELSLS